MSACCERLASKLGSRSQSITRILLADDFPIWHSFVSSLIPNGSNWRIVGHASDGIEAVQKAQELQPDLVLLDIGLPKLNGIEAARQIRRIAAKTKIVFLSQLSDSDIVREALSTGASAYVVKSAAGRDLLPAIEAAVDVSAGLELSQSTDWKSPRRHEIIFSSDDELLQDSLADFIAAALKAGDAAIVWATEPHRDNLRQRLRTRDVDVDAAIRAGIYIERDAAETADPVLMAGVIRSLIQAAYRAGKEHPRVAACGERAGRLWDEGRIDEAIRLEQLLNELAEDLAEVDILCVYPAPLGHDNNDALSLLCAEHSAVHSQ